MMSPASNSGLRSLVWSLALVGAALPACGGGSSGPAGGDPRGTDSTFNFSWRIDGQDPSAAGDVCARAGVRFIRMTVLDDAMAEHRYDAFQFDCHLGRYRSAQPELRAGTYSIYWEAVAADGTRVSLASGTYVNGVLTPTHEQFTATRGGNVDFDAPNHEVGFAAVPTNFSTGAGPLQVAIRWAQAAGATQGVDCSTAGVGSLAWTLRLSNGVAVETHATHEQCSAMYAALRWDRVNFDSYILDVDGFDASGRQAWHSRCTDLLAATADATGAMRECLVGRAP